MATLPDASVDAVVCDPPYELGFMGKSWDASGIAYDVEVWRRAFRVLKPGGHLLAFSGSRTYHRMTCAIEDAGFDIRDQIMWVYGSGFPKSLDVSKAIDKIDRNGPIKERARTFTAWMRSTGITAAQVNEATGSFMGSHYLTAESQPSVATADLFDLLRPLLPPVPHEIEELVRSRTVESENMKRRSVVGEAKVPVGHAFAGGVYGNEGSEHRVVAVTVPHTDAARQWSGWGTALKPAHEPICMARKPLIGTVAANVLAHGTGAINVDGCRVEGKSLPASWGGRGLGYGGTVPSGFATTEHAGGRWPANFIHDGSDEATAGLGEAARFFYTPKAGREDREEGCDEHELVRRTDGREAENHTPRLRTTERRNHHPTVKPTDLMRYLCRLVTPPGGTVLDPFTGSGSTGRGAVLEGFDFIGCELSPEYAEIARARIRGVAMPLFPVEVE
jgi:DNA modification methylase